MTNINQSFSVMQEVSQALIIMHNPSCKSTMYRKSKAVVYRCSVENLESLENSQEKTR